MIIDTEWGGFGDSGEAEYLRTQYDKIVDHRSDHPGSYRDDWGTYSNTKQIMEELGIEDYSFSDILLFREVCLVVSRRSANLIAADMQPLSLRPVMRDIMECFFHTELPSLG
ncbi:Hexokinase [Teladorsagia circumcincta]|uniref:Phosphotransferase n=1 Tax=Teladorsagia circumcincta TaxID=45464 RepID=A0A2G9TTT6_TELCI|nr:Hexokinase [Teladorsagia circumcincta]